MELNELMKQCLIETNNECPDLDYVDTVVEAFRRYIVLVGEPLEFEDENQGEEFFKKALAFLVDCVLFNMVEKGVIELSGMEDGELVYQVSAEF